MICPSCDTTRFTSRRCDNCGTLVCLRCREPFGEGKRCANCNVHKDRRIVKRIGRRKIGGKRGRNSGRVGTAGKKK